MMNRKIIVLLALLFLVKSHDALGASFDCGLPNLSFIEIQVCTSNRVSIEDEYMSDAYSTLRGKMEDDDREILLDTQRNWLRKRNNCRNDAFIETCLYESYRERSRTLNVWRVYANINRFKSCSNSNEGLKFFECAIGWKPFGDQLSFLARLDDFEYELPIEISSLNSYLIENCTTPINSTLEMANAIGCYMGSVNDMKSAVKDFLHSKSKNTLFAKVKPIDEFSISSSNPTITAPIIDALQNGGLDDGCEGNPVESYVVKILEDELYGQGYYLVDYSCGISQRLALFKQAGETLELLNTYQYNYCYRECEGFTKAGVYVNDFNGDSHPDLLITDDSTGVLVSVIGRIEKSDTFQNWSPRVQNFPEEFGYSEENLPLVDLIRYKEARLKTVWPFHAFSRD